MARDDDPDPEGVGKPVGPFDDHDACVRHFEDDPEVDDPDALCNWMEQREASIDYDPDEDDIQSFVESLDDAAADTVLSHLTTSFVSAVETPAQDSQWVAMKAESEPDWSATVPLVTQKDWSRNPNTAALARDDEDDGPEQKALAPVLVPNDADKQGDIVPKGEIESAAHDFLKNYRNIDSDHDLVEGKGEVVESYTLPEDTEFDTVESGESKEYPEGTWMMMVEFDDETWDRVQAGELTGFSIYGEAEQTAIDDIVGASAKSEEPNRTTVAMSTDDSGPTNTMNEDTDFLDIDLNHVHKMSDDEFDALVDELDDFMSTLEAMREAEASDDEGDEGEDDDEDNDDETEMSNSNKDADDPDGQNDGGGDDFDVEDTLKSVQSTVEDTQETVSSVKSAQDDLQERVDALEAEVMEKDGEDDPSDDDADSGEAEGAEKSLTLKDLGLSEADLPDDESERREAIRKAAFEPTDDVGDDGEGISVDLTADDIEV